MGSSSWRDYTVSLRCLGKPWDLPGGAGECGPGDMSWSAALMTQLSSQRRDKTQINEFSVTDLGLDSGNVRVKCCYGH